jgi:hypothetical protein
MTDPLMPLNADNQIVICEDVSRQADCEKEDGSQHRKAYQE